MGDLGYEHPVSISKGYLRQGPRPIENLMPAGLNVTPDNGRCMASQTNFSHMSSHPGNRLGGQGQPGPGKGAKRTQIRSQLNSQSPSESPGPGSYPLETRHAPAVGCYTSLQGGCAYQPESGDNVTLTCPRKMKHVVAETEPARPARQCGSHPAGPKWAIFWPCWVTSTLGPKWGNRGAKATWISRRFLHTFADALFLAKKETQLSVDVSA